MGSNGSVSRTVLMELCKRFRHPAAHLAGQHEALTQLGSGAHSRQVSAFGVRTTQWHPNRHTDAIRRRQREGLSSHRT